VRKAIRLVGFAGSGLFALLAGVNLFVGHMWSRDPWMVVLPALVAAGCLGLGIRAQWWISTGIGEREALSRYLHVSPTRADEILDAPPSREDAFTGPFGWALIGTVLLAVGAMVWMLRHT
jgi:hypothetical protein